MSAGRLLPILGLASAVGLYCGVQEQPQAPPPPSESRPQGLTVTLPDCMASSLISAIASANAAGSGQHQITLMAGCTYTLSTVNNYYYGPNALPVIEQDITIDGSSTGAIIERDGAGAAMRLFYVARPDLPPSKPGSLTLRNVTLRNGLARGGTGGATALRTSGGGMGAGGAIFAHGNVTLDRALLTANTARGGDSGNAMTGGMSSAGGGGMGGNGMTGGGGGGFQDATGANGGNGVGTTEGGKVVVGMAGAGGTDASGTENGGNAASGQGGNGGGKRHLGGGGAATGTGVPGTAGDGGAGGASATVSGGGGAGFGGNGGTGGTGRGGGGGFGGGGAQIAGGGVGGGGGNGNNGGAGGGGFGGGGGSSGSTNGGGGGFGGGGGSCPTPSVAGTSVFGGGAGGVGSAGGQVSGGGGGGMGGAVFVHLGQLTVVNSTLYANTAQGGLAGTATTKGSDGAGLGGAIFSLNGTVNITSSTLAGNKASSGGTGSGGALYVLSFGKKADGTTDETASATVRNSILGDSTDTAATPAMTSDVAVNQAAGGAQLTVAADDVIEAAIFTTGGAAVTGTPTLADAKLDTLKNNGGPTQTLALLSGSPALAAGTLSVCTSATLGCVDQRGSYRSTACDIGAYEDSAPTTKPQACACAVNAECQSGSCVDTVCCDTTCGGGSSSDCQACVSSLTGMGDGTCSAILATANYTCRQAAAGKPCDVAEVCSGASSCPMDQGTTDTNIVCRATVAGLCDQVDHCDGTSPDCADTKKAMGTVCRAKVASCDKAETCDGTTDSCPTDAIAMSADMQLCRAKSPTNDCTKDSYCDGSGQLCRVAYEPAGTTCRRFTSGVVTGCGGTCDAFGGCRGTFTAPMGGSCP